jgi:hypothetical protein
MGVISIYCEGRGKRTLYLLHIENWIDKEVIRVSAKARPTREEREQVLLARELEKKRREEGDKKKKPKKPDVIAPQEEEEEELTREILQERENEKNIRRQRALEVWGLV